MKELKTPFRQKNLIKKGNKNSKKHVNRKPQARKLNFVQTAFSHSTLKNRKKTSRPKSTRFFAQLPVLSLPKTSLQFD